MKKGKIILVLVASMLLHLGCEKVTFLPIQGDVEGYITDNNGQPVSGATVSATFEAPTQFGEAQEQSKSVTADSDGYYHLTNLWDEVLLYVEHPGLEPVKTRVKLSSKESEVQADLAMNGSPTIKGVSFDKTLLLIGSGLADTIHFDLEVEDTYNSQPGEYLGNLLLEDSAGITRRIVSATVKEQSLYRVLLTGIVTAGELPAGSYQVNVEITDPDGLSHWITAEESIRLE